MRRALIAVSAVAAVTAALMQVPAQAAPAQEQEFVVLYTAGASLSDAHAAVTAAGGTLVNENAEVGVATVRTTDGLFLTKVRGQSSLAGAVANKVVGSVPKDEPVVPNAVEKVAGTKAVKYKVKQEPLADLQWDMKQIHAAEAHKIEKGDRRVLVGVMDTGIDASHPDIKGNFDYDLSRNFTQDVPADANGTEIDGPCASDPD